MPAGVSVTRGGGLPIRALSVVPLQQMAPRRLDVDDLAVLDAVAERARRDQDRVAQDERAGSRRAPGRPTGPTSIGAPADGRRSAAATVADGRRLAREAPLERGTGDAAAPGTRSPAR